MGNRHPDASKSQFLTACHTSLPCVQSGLCLWTEVLRGAYGCFSPARKGELNVDSEEMRLTDTGGASKAPMACLLCQGTPGRRRTLALDHGYG